MRFRSFTLCIALLFLYNAAFASKLLIPMDADGQSNHLKAYGIAYAALQQGIPVYWLLNYKGGSFALDNDREIAGLCKDRGVTCTKISNNEYDGIVKSIKAPGFNGDIVKLEKAPKIAVYTPLGKMPWDDAVTLALTYAEIPFDKLYADEVLAGDLDKYDWLHLHHEDFTGQMGKFWAQYQKAIWYMEDKRNMDALVAKHGFKKQSELQLAVVKKIRDFVAGGGNLFAMCTATDTYDLALAADGTDIDPEPFDGDPMDNNAQKKLDYSKCFAFTNFTLSTNPYEFEFSNIDNTNFRHVPESADRFALHNFSAKTDPVPAMLCQNHTTSVKGFMGQTTAFRLDNLKPGVVILGDFVAADEARYIHGLYGNGSWTFYGGHDPEDYQHTVGDMPTNLEMYHSSPGYRLILNNLLSPAAHKKEVPHIIDAPAITQATSVKPIQPNTPASDQYNIYPSPANNQLIVSFNHNYDLGTVKGSAKIEHVTITNLEGKEIISQPCSSESVNINVKELPSGMYMVIVNGIYAGKFMKE